MKRTQTLAWAAALLGTSTALLVACGGSGDGDGSPPRASVTSEVPPQAATSSSVATDYVAELSAVPESNTDALEPVAVPDMLAVDDSSEPAVVN